jgi:hypothetical protein
MILESLVGQFEQRFLHEKRAQVCLWFDEKQEFTRLLPALQSHLAERKPSPFILLEYDATKKQGQIWLKYRMYQLLSAASAEERRRLRFVLYLPFSEDSLDVKGEESGVCLDLLAEYRVSGTIWRINGKRPTLFSFLRQAGVSLPDSPSDQRHIYDGGRDSLLAKYATKFIDRPAVFWTTDLTPDLAQSRLIGDVDQTIFELTVDPEGTWKTLQERGLDREFLEMVRERYGFNAPSRGPSDWVEELVTVLALTETYLGYGEPGDFPFADRLPPLGLRPHHKQLLQRWLRDTEYRAAWDRWIEAAESKVDLAVWAKGRPGLSFGFPHLVRLRWQEVLLAFEQAASKASSTTEFFERYGEIIAKEAEITKAASHPVGAWTLLRNLDLFLRDCIEARGEAEKSETVEDLIKAYVKWAGSVDKRYIEIRFTAEEENLPVISRVADRSYNSYADTLNARFFERFSKIGTGELPGIPSVTTHLEEEVWYHKGRRAVILVDGLRYDCALSLAELLSGYEVKTEPIGAAIPTVTSVGMTALLPLTKNLVEVEIANNSLHPKVQGKDTSVLDNRMAILADLGADCRDINDVEAQSTPQKKLSDLLVVFGHEELDRIGHGSAETLIRHIHIEIQRLARLIRKLHRWGYEEVHVVTDHGFILTGDENRPEDIPCDKNWCSLRKERFALVPATADLPLALFPFSWDETLKVAVPPGRAFFKGEKSFSHGGATLQELVIPHLISRSRVRYEKRVNVEVVLPVFELMRTAVKVTFRPKAGESAEKQMTLFTKTGETGRTLVIDVLRKGQDGKRKSVLDPGPKSVRVEPRDKEQNVTLFFHSGARFQKGELLDLDIRDEETTEQFPPGGIKLTVGRDM